MVDSIEIRLNQITEAIKGLYHKSLMSQGEINNSLTGFLQKYENLNTVSGEKIVTTLVNEFRKSIDSKYGQTNDYLKSLEETLKNFMVSHSNQSPKFQAELSKIINDIANTYSKLNSQDLALQKIFNIVEQQKNNNPSLEIAKLTDNFLNFSKGFENITITLNKNFADFLEQVKRHGSKDELLEIKAELDTITGNVNSVISAISVIDSKYRDLTSLISVVQNKENVFNDALKEVSRLNNAVSNLKADILDANAKQDIQSLGSDVKNQIENVKYEIQKVINTAGDAGIKTELFNLKGNFSDLSNTISVLSGNLNGAKDEVRNLQTTVQGLGNELKDVHNLINDEILYKSHQNQDDFERYLSSVREDIKTLLAGLTTFKRDIAAINEGNIKVLQEPIVKAMDELKNQDLGKNIRELSDNLRNITFEIQSSIQNMQSNLNDMNSLSSIQILTQISDSIPVIADKLEIFRTHVVTENSTNLGQIRTSFSEVVNSIHENLKDTVEKIQDDTKTISIETLDTLKVDLQRLSDHLIDSIDGISDRIEKEFSNFKVDFQEFSLKQGDGIEKISDKLSALEVGLENFSNDTIEKLNNSINIINAKSQDNLNVIKSDILECIGNVDKANKNSLSQFEIKIDKLLDNYIGANLDNIVEKKSLRETIVDVETKIDRTNLQQIHNAKELLEEIQSGNSNLAMKLSNIEESKDFQSILNAISKISDKLQNIEEFNNEITDNLNETKEHISQKLKDNVQKISALVDKPKDNAFIDEQNSNIDNLSNKVQEYLSNFEYLKSNISQEIRENLAGEFAKLNSSINTIKTSDENSNYSYTLEDVESDLAKIRLSVEKSLSGNNELKNIVEKIIELRTVALENIKINRDAESELGHLTGWFKDAVAKINDLTSKVDDIQNTGFEDIKTRIIQSEKSKNTLVEFTGKIENTLKYLVKNAQSQEVKVSDLTKKVDLISQSQTEAFNPSQFIDYFYENMTQTKMLSNRVEIIEDKINNIQNAVEKLLGYIEQ